MANKNSLHNVVALNQFSTLTEDEMIGVEGESPFFNIRDRTQRFEH